MQKNNVGAWQRFGLGKGLIRRHHTRFQGPEQFQGRLDGGDESMITAGVMRFFSFLSSRGELLDTSNGSNFGLSRLG